MKPLPLGMDTYGLVKPFKSITNDLYNQQVRSVRCLWMDPMLI